MSSRFASTRRVSRLLLVLGLLLGGFVGGFVTPAGAYAEDVAVDPFIPPPDQTGFTSFPSTRTPGPFGFDAMLWLDYGLNTLESDAFRRGDVAWVEHRLAATLSAQLGLWGRSAVALRIPAVLVQRGTDLPSAPSLASEAIGNPSIDARVRVLGAAVRPDGSVSDGAALAVRALVMVPVGTSDAYFADDAWRTELSLITDVTAFGLGAGLAVGYRHRFSEVDLAGQSLRHQLRAAGGLRVPFPLIALAKPGQVQESALVELDFGTDPARFFARATTPLEGRISYRLGFSDYTFSLGAGAALTKAFGVPDLRVLLGVGYSPRMHDQDADGVPDGVDQCLHLAEDRDGFEDDDGCPEPDNDQDMILDEDDRCPIDAAEPGRDDDEDGCTDP
jgi:hypothetical protein